MKKTGLPDLRSSAQSATGESLAKILLSVLLPTAIAVAAIWVPFGFSLGVLVEGWGILGLFEELGRIFWVTPSSLIPAHAFRPLTVFPHALAMTLNPDSFIWWHVLLIMSLIIKGAGCSYLAWKVLNSWFWAAVFGVLVILYPADTMQLAFRSFHINWALALLLLGSCAFLVAMERKSRRGEILLATLAGILLFLACSMYEVVIVLIPLPALLLYARYGSGCMQILRQHWIPPFAWLAGSGCYGAYVLWAQVNLPSVSYQVEIIGTDPLGRLLRAFPDLFSVGLVRSMFGGWFDAALMVVQEYETYGYLLGASAIVLGAILLLSRAWQSFPILLRNPVRSQGHFDRAAVIRLAAVGFVVMLAGYAPYLLSPSFVTISQRTFLAATLGAAMVWVGVLIGASILSRWLGLALAGAAISLGLGAQLYQYHHYLNIFEQQRQLLISIVKNFDGQLNGKTLLIEDHSNRIGHTWMFLPGLMEGALTYLYDRIFLSEAYIAKVHVCHQPSGEWQRSGALGLKGRCEETATEWIFHFPEPVSGPGYTSQLQPPPERLSKEDAIVMRIKRDGSIAPPAGLDDYRSDLQTGNSPVARRLRGALGDHRPPWDLIRFADENMARETYRWDFGKWWSLELPIQGSGWREAEWAREGISFNASAWKSAEQSSLLFHLTPADHEYQLEGEYEMLLLPDQREQTRISVNGQDLPISWVSDLIFEAVIPAGILREGLNEIVFTAPQDPDFFGYGGKLDWFEVFPLRP